VPVSSTSLDENYSNSLGEEPKKQLHGKTIVSIALRSLSKMAKFGCSLVQRVNHGNGPTFRIELNQQIVQKKASLEELDLLGVKMDVISLNIQLPFSIQITPIP